jgi:cystathionine beta-lyase
VILQELRGVSKYTKKRRYFRFDKDEHIVRLHIGLEDPKDLIEDLKKSLKYIK